MIVDGVDDDADADADADVAAVGPAGVVGADTDDDVGTGTGAATVGTWCKGAAGETGLIIASLDEGLLRLVPEWCACITGA